MMSTPGRKRVQPIPIDDDDDDDENDNNLNSNEIYLSSSSDINIENPTTSSEFLLSSPYKTQPSVIRNPYVALNFDELSHIRNAQTNSEFATLLYDFDLYKTVVNGYVCFSCRKVKFSLFKPGIRCAICLQRICSKCQRKIINRNDKFCFISLSLLRSYSTSSKIPSLVTSSITLRKNETPESKSSSSTTSSLSLINNSKSFNKKKISNNTFICCIDCFLLFDPATIV